MVDIYAYFWDWDPPYNKVYHLTRLSKRDGVVYWELINDSQIKEVDIPLLGPMVNYGWQDSSGYPKFRMWRLKYPKLSNYFFSIQFILSLIGMLIVFVPVITVIDGYYKIIDMVNIVKKYCHWNK